MKGQKMRDEKTTEKKEMNGVIFDIDGVLIDVKGSYRKTIIETVQFFTGFVPALEDTQKIKDFGGFNNDWKATFALILCGGKIDSTLEQAKPFGTGLQAIERVCGELKNREEVISKFQELYSVNKQNERLLIDKPFLSNIGLKRGILTGRPKAEALEVLGRFGILESFEAISALEDLGGNPGRPNPYGLNRCKGLLGIDSGFFCGDTADDMRAGKAAGMVSVGITTSAKPELLLGAGADYVFDSVNQLGECLGTAQPTPTSWGELL